MPPPKLKTPDRPLVFVDAFAGCGGLSLGLFEAGLQGLFAIEHDSFAFETLSTNLLSSKGKHCFKWPAWLPKAAIGIDSLLSDHSNEMKGLCGRVDLLVGGPPCQGFSSAGRRQHDDPRNQLFKKYLELVTVLKPRAVLIENVRGFTADFDKGKFSVKNYAHNLRAALSLNYDVYEDLIDLSLLGVPQARTRYFLLALARGTTSTNPFRELRRRAPGYLRSLGIHAPVSSWRAISDLEVARGGEKDSVDTRGFSEIRYLRPLTNFQKLMRKGSAYPTDLRLARHSEKVANRFAEIIEISHADGRLNTALSSELRQRFGLRKTAIRVLDPERPSPTITSMPDDLIHYSEPRTLTVRENARLQSFPDWYVFKGKYTSGGIRRRREVPRFTQVANAVPPLAARAIGLLIQDLMTGS